MLEQLFNLVQGQSEQDIINNPAIPNEHNKEAVGLATQNIFSGLQGALASGGLQQVLSLFSGKSSAGMSNPLVSGIAGSLVNNLMGKFGLSNGAASGIAQSLIPSVLSKLVNNTTDPNNKAFDMNGILSALTGGAVAAPNATQNAGAQAGGFDFNSILSQLTGGQAVTPPQNEANPNQDGGGIMDLISQFTGGANQQAGAAAPQQGGGLQDILSKLTQGAQQSQQQQQQQQQQGGGIMDLLKGVIGG